jgi:hypothetical protein
MTTLDGRPQADFSPVTAQAAAEEAFEDFIGTSLALPHAELPMATAARMARSG